MNNVYNTGEQFYFLSDTRLNEEDGDNQCTAIYRIIRIYCVMREWSINFKDVIGK
jgi:hypothetical protein